jgi:hypothetical protein
MKNHLPLQFVKSFSFKSLAFYVIKLSSLQKHNFPKRFCLTWKKKEKTRIDFAKIDKLQLVTPSFDLWMLKGMSDVFTLVIEVLGVNWQPKHVIISLFETTKITIREALIKSPTYVLHHY